MTARRPSDRALPVLVALTLLADQTESRRLEFDEPALLDELGISHRTIVRVWEELNTAGAAIVEQRRRGSAYDTTRRLTIDPTHIWWADARLELARRQVTA